MSVWISHDDAIVVSLSIINFDVRCLLIDNGSSVDILFYDAFSRINLPRDHLLRTSSSLVGFSRDGVLVEGTITLPMIMGQAPSHTTAMLTFLVVKVPLA